MNSGRLIIAALSLHSALSGASIRFQKSDEEFANPERGFSSAFVGNAPSAAAMQSLRLKNNITLIRRIFALDAFREAPISPAALAAFDAEFAAARQAGVKIVARFCYNFDQSGPDAELARVISHLDQLAPLLKKNSDVIAFVQAGFIGRWGEWHDSTHNLDNTNSRSAILKKLLSALPGDRMVALRYPEQKREIFSRGNLSSSDAFAGSDASRVGFHNDCFLASDDDWGTYFKNAPDTIQGQKAYVGRETKYVVMGGETCNLCAKAADCRIAVSELEKFHYSELNSQYEAKVLAKWQEGGCMPEIKRRLGYRLRLSEAELPASATRGATIQFKFNFINDGFAAPYNPRPIELVLRGAKSHVELRIPLKADPRRWLPGDDQNVEAEWAVPPNLTPDSYYAFVKFPDPAQALSRRPEYCIRLANDKIWEAATGNNYLKAVINIQ